jgi:hypothetical protein
MVPNVLVDADGIDPRQPASRRATDATEALSRWMQLIAHHAALPLSLVRGGASAWISLNPRTGHAGSVQR